MSDDPHNQVERVAPLMARFERLDERYKGFLDGYVSSTVNALATGLDLVERMQAEKRATKRLPRGRARLRLAWSSVGAR